MKGAPEVQEIETAAVVRALEKLAVVVDASAEEMRRSGFAGAADAMLAVSEIMRHVTANPEVARRLAEADR